MGIKRDHTTRLYVGSVDRSVVHMCQEVDDYCEMHDGLEILDLLSSSKVLMKRLKR